MTSKLLILIAAGTTVALALLALRQEHYVLSHQIAQTVREVDRSRQNLWQLQRQLAQEIQPQALKQAIEESGLQLEPILPTQDSPPPPTQAQLRMAERSRTNRLTR